MRVGHLRIRVDFGSDSVREALLFSLPRVDEDPVAAEWRLLVAEAGDWSGFPAAPWNASDVGVRGEVAAATVGDYRTAYFAPSGVLSTIDIRRRLAMCWLPAVDHLPWYERAAPLRTLLHWILAEGGLTFAHAAAVAPGASGALLAGAGGSGKSTTAMLCLREGFAYAGDDYVAASVSTAEVRAHRLFGTAKLSAGSLEKLPFLARGVLVAPEGEEKGVVDLGVIAPGGLAASFPLAALVVPRVAGGRTQLQRMSAAEALRALAPTTLLQLPGSGRETFRRLAQIAERLPAWRLELGTDLDAIPRQVARAVEESLCDPRSA